MKPFHDSILSTARRVDFEMQLLGSLGKSNEGVFVFPSPVDGVALRCIATRTHGWDHVSVSCAMRCPVWEEMAWIKDQFFEDDETAMQIHPPRSEWVNNHPFCLHLWRDHRGSIPYPPRHLV